MALALPEVPLAARRALLELATAHGWLRVAGVVPDELEQVRDSGLLGLVDVLALNIEEAATLGGVSVERPASRGRRAPRCRALTDLRSPARVVVTAGARGSWTWDGHDVVHAPASDPEARVVSTAGAGDAHLSGVVVGLVAGLELAPANAFASIVSGLKVRSPHTINPDIDPRAVVDAAARRGLAAPDRAVRGPCRGQHVTASSECRSFGTLPDGRAVEAWRLANERRGGSGRADLRRGPAHGRRARP